MSRNSVWVFTENAKGKALLETILGREYERGAIGVGSVSTSSAVISNAELTLLTYPRQPVALVFNVDTFEPYRLDDERDAARRILGRVARSGWLDVWANPDVSSWIMADPRIRRRVEEDGETVGNYQGRAYLIRDWVRDEPIDREAIARAHPEFRGLADFIEEHAPAARPLASPVAGA